MVGVLALEAVVDEGHGLTHTVVGESPVLRDGVRGGVGVGRGPESTGSGCGFEDLVPRVFDLVGVAAEAFGQAADASHQRGSAAAATVAGRR